MGVKEAILPRAAHLLTTPSVTFWRLPSCPDPQSDATDALARLCGSSQRSDVCQPRLRRSTPRGRQRRRKKRSDETSRPMLGAPRSSRLSCSARHKQHAQWAEVRSVGWICLVGRSSFRNEGGPRPGTMSEVDIKQARLATEPFDRWHLCWQSDILSRRNAVVRPHISLPSIPPGSRTLSSRLANA